MLEQLFINNEIEIALLLAVAAILILLTAYSLGTGLSALIIPWNYNRYRCNYWSVWRVRVYHSTQQTSYRNQNHSKRSRRRLLQLDQRWKSHRV